MTTGLIEPSQVEELVEFCEGVRSHDQVRVYSGQELEEVHQKNCSVVDATQSVTFLPFGSAGPADFTASLFSPSYTPIAILFEPFVGTVGAATPIGNSYEVQVRTQLLGHYKQGSMLANMAVTPGANPDAMNKRREAEERTGSIMSKIGSVVKDGVSWIWNNKATIGKAIAPFLGF
jgi:hypothetical protein